MRGRQERTTDQRSLSPPSPMGTSGQVTSHRAPRPPERVARAPHLRHRKRGSRIFTSLSCLWIRSSWPIWRIRSASEANLP